MSKDFYSPTKGNLSENQVLQDIVSYIREKPDRFYDIIVGCDSPSIEEPFFPVAVVILRVGEGGRFYLKKITYPALNKKFIHWKSRILNEVLLSCELAQSLREKFQDVMDGLKGDNLNYQFRYIHADVGEKGQTQEMIKEVTGLIIGNGFEPRIKPVSFAASCVADRYT